MGIGVFAQVAIDIFLGLGLFVCAMRISRAPKDDPRLSRGLQLLQSKIAVLEDLSDKSEAQATHLTALLEQKSRDVQARIEEAERHVLSVRASMQRSLEVAKIFEDKIPHHEIIERQNTAKYVQAARFAHQGLSVDDIASRVDLPRGEIEFIAKVNRDRLMFDERSLPAWASDRGELDFAPAERSFTPPLATDAPTVAYVPPPASATASLERLGEEFRRACEQADGVETSFSAEPAENDDAVAAAREMAATIDQESAYAPVDFSAAASLSASIEEEAPPPTPTSEDERVEAAAPAPTAEPEGPVIRKVEFPRISAPPVRPTDNLR